MSEQLTPNPLGQQTAANSIPVILPSATITTLTPPTTITANAGSNLNTSTLALETGGNLATVAGAVSSSKMNVNLSSGSIPAGANTIGSLKLTDGTNTVNVLAATSVSNAAGAQAAQLVAGSFAEQASLSAGSLNADLVPSTDVSNYRSWSLQITALASGGALTVQGSNDNSNWFNINSAFYYNGATSAATSSLGFTGIVYGVVYTRYLRIRQTSWASGSTTGIFELYTQSVPLVTVGASVAATQSGAWSTVPIPATSGGLSTSLSSIKAAATSVKGSGGQVYGWSITNNNAAISYVQFFDLATGSVTLGTTVPKYSIGVAASSAIILQTDIGIVHGTAITVAATTTVGGNTGPTNNVDINVFYK